MASSSETINIQFFHDDEDDDDQQQHHHGVSRLSMCSRSNHSIYGDDDDDDDDGAYHDEGMLMDISRLSMEESKTSLESTDGDADGELSEDKEKETAGDMSDSDKEVGFFGNWGFSVPAVPVWKTRRDLLLQPDDIKKYASESEIKGRCGGRKKSRRKNGEKMLEKAWEMKKCRALIMDENDCNNSVESEGIAKVGLCVDMEEIKACRDLGFELNHGLLLDLPTRLSGSTMDTSSGGNSPIANWRISSPGDDPKDVKARLKVWAQAVALASTAHLNY